MRAWMSWSSGKDSAFALHTARQSDEVNIVGLLTTVTAAYDRVSMHAVRRRLLELQAERLGLPLNVVEIPAPCPNSLYEEKMADAVRRARSQDVEACVFGDLYLQDVRAYRERMLEGSGMRPLFPLWSRDTFALAREMLDAGLVAYLTCVDPNRVPKEWAGRRFDSVLLDELPEGVDPCGERGEFHTVVTDGPGFRSPIRVEVGEVVERDGFVFADVVPLE